MHAAGFNSRRRPHLRVQSKDVIRTSGNLDSEFISFHPRMLVHLISHRTVCHASWCITFPPTSAWIGVLSCRASRNKSVNYWWSLLWAKIDLISPTKSWEHCACNLQVRTNAVFTLEQYKDRTITKQMYHQHKSKTDLACARGTHARQLQDNYNTSKAEISKFGRT